MALCIFMDFLADCRAKAVLFTRAAEMDDDFLEVLGMIFPSGLILCFKFQGPKNNRRQRSLI